MKKLKLTILIVMIVSLGLLFVGCNESVNPEGNWTLISIENNEISYTIADETLPNTISMYLEAKEEFSYSISGFSSVNTYAGLVNVEKNTVKVNPLAVTKMLGSEASQNVEDAYLPAVQEGGNISIQEKDGETILVLKNSKAGTTLEFKKTVLENTSWNLVMYNIENAVTEVPTVVENAYIGFAEDGSIHGNTGTNQLMGTFEYTKDGSLTFEKMGMTRMAAMDEDAYQFEVRIMELYSQVVAFSISGSQLTLSNDSGETVLVFKR